MFLFFVGCTGGDFDDNDDGGNPGGRPGNSYDSVEGIKTISRPGDYDFSGAVGDENSEYYFNIFSAWITYSLYDFYYRADSNLHKNVSPIFEPLYQGFDESNGYTYKFVENGDDTFGESDSDKMYVFDTPRYSISSITTENDVDGNFVKQTLKIDLSAGWNWMFKNDAKHIENMFKMISAKDSSVVCNVSGTTLTVTIPKDSIRESWLEYVSKGDLDFTGFDENYVKFFQFDEKSSGKTKYYDSPYYQKLNGETVTTLNYFQDAIEYMVYKTVLGYDYNSDYDFELVYGTGEQLGWVVDINVNEGSNTTSVVDALESVKKTYQKDVKYVGITAGDKTKIIDFIKYKVIGLNALNYDNYTIAGVGVEINRNYNILINNLVDFACGKAPIGFDGESSLGLDNAYIASEISDYSGDYFFTNPFSSTAGSFDHIKKAEYQALIVKPLAKQIGKALNEIILSFEYYDEENGYNFGADGLTANDFSKDGLTINVGLRYFDHNSGEFSFNLEAEFKVAYGSYDELDIDTNDFAIAYFSRHPELFEDYYDIILNDPIAIKGGFNDDIGGGVINTASGETKGSKVINGIGDARKYFKLNESKTRGFYGTLNPDMFTGSDGCDYFEIYFDIVKGGNPNTNYNFKVGFMSIDAD